MSDFISLITLVSKYLAWCEAHMAASTHVWYKSHLGSFMAHMREAGEMAALDLKPFHVQEWIDTKKTWGSTHKRGGIVAVQRIFNWGEEMGYVDRNPIKKLKKPPAKRRETYMRPEDFEAIIDRLPLADPFRDLLIFAWYSGARPQEVRHIEPRHVELDRERIAFPAAESKGKRRKRVIYLRGPALTIIQQRMRGNPAGKLFRNSEGAPWSKYALCNRMHRLSQKTGKRMAMYDARHGFATRKLKQGHDGITVAALMGHANGNMVATVYSHVDSDEDFLKQALEE